MIKIEDFNFDLPNELIAQHPIENRDQSKLLVVDRKTGKLEHRVFYDIIDYLNDGDCLVLNETKVLPARLIGQKVDTEATIEILLLKQVAVDTWETLVKPAKRVTMGTKVMFGNQLLATCVGIFDEGIRHFHFTYEGIFIEVLEKLGTMPLPPYIKERLNDQNRYQTVYAKALGSAAAPTAGLHFTASLLSKIKEKNIQIIPIVLHVGLGTFRPVVVENISEHHMHEELYHISSESAAQLNQARKAQKRIVAVGTTSLRALESNYQDHKFVAGVFNTSIFIYPGYQFKVVDQLITNFHLPKSTLFMLVSAFSSVDIMKNAYQEAIQHHYRFFSFGDAMFIHL